MYYSGSMIRFCNLPVLASDVSLQHIIRIITDAKSAATTLHHETR